MFGFYIALGVAAVVVFVMLAVKAYWSFLELYFVAQERASEVHTVSTRDVWEINLYRYRRGRSNGEPVLLIHGICSNHRNFTEPEGASLIDELVDRGYDCWAMDARLCHTSKPAFERSRETATLDDILLFDIPAAIRHIRKTTSYGRVHWVGHSMGGMMLYAYAQHFGGAHIASGTTLGAPIGFDDMKERIPPMMGVVKKHPQEAVNVFRALLPILYYLRIRLPIFPTNMRNIHPKMRPGALFHAVEAPMPAAMEQFHGWVRSRTWKMLNGQLDVKAGLNTIDVPLFAIFGPRDPFIPLARAKAFFDALPNADKKVVVLSTAAGCQHDYDHCDLTFGVDAPRMVFAPIAKWLEAHPIHERVRAEEITEDDVPIRPALSADQRVAILSGETYTQVAKVALAEKSVTVTESVVVGITEEVASPGTPVAASRVELAVERIEEVPVPVKQAPAKTVPATINAAKGKKPADKPASKAPGKPALKAAPKKAPKTTRKPGAKAPAKPAPKAAVKPAAKAEAKKPVAPAKAVPAKVAPAKAKPVAAKAKPAAVKAKAAPAKAKPAGVKAKVAPVKAKPVPAVKKPVTSGGGTPRVQVAPSKAEKQRPSLFTKSAILSASEMLKDLEKKKK